MLSEIDIHKSWLNRNNSIYIGVKLNISKYNKAFQIHTPKITLTVLYSNITKTLTQWSEKECIPILVKACNYLESISGIKNLHTNLLYIPTGYKRFLPDKKGDTILPKHINGGFTIHSPEKQDYDILVYRKEDALKVMLHELVHRYKIDYEVRYMSSQSDIESIFCKKYNITLQHSMRLGLSEVIAEVMAFHIIGINESIRTRINEIAWNYLQHFNNGEIKEGTHSYMYIIGRAALLDNKEFIKLVETRQLTINDSIRLLDINIPKMISTISKKKYKHVRSLAVKST